MTDLEIVQGLKDGDSNAARVLLDQWQAPLVRYFMASLPDPSIAEDAAQEVFLRVVRHAQAGRLDTLKSLRAYVFTVASRLAIDLRRTWSRRPYHESLDVSPSGDEGKPTRHESIPSRQRDARAALLEREQMALVSEALGELDDETRQVILLRHVEGMSSQEVAAIMGVAEGTVWSRLHRGLDRLRARLAMRKVEDLERPARKRSQP